MKKEYLLKKLFGEESYNNKMYGHNIILRKYANVKLPYAISGQYQHGYHMGTGIHGFIYKHTEEDKSKRYFVWNRKNIGKCISLGYRNVSAIGAPMLYAPIKNIRIANNHNLLFFPIHSTEDALFYDSIKAYEKYIQNILKLNNIFKSFTICLYWVEYENKKIRDLFNKENIKIVTLGHRDNNPNFLNNFIDLVNKFTYVSSNSFSTAVLYSLFLRKKVFIYNIYDKSDINFKNSEFRENTMNSNDYLRKKYPELLWENFDDKPHYEIAREELGLENKKTHSELRQIFGWKPSSVYKNLVRKTKKRLSRMINKI